MNILLVGLIGSGKTSVGQKIAQKIKSNFVEMDRLVLFHSGLQNMSDVKPLLWKECQLEISKDLASQKDQVIAASGDMLENNLNLMYFQHHEHDTLVVYLRASVDTIVSRLMTQQNHQSREKLAEKVTILKAEREALAVKMSDLVIDTDTMDVNEIVSEILKNIH